MQTFEYPSSVMSQYHRIKTLRDSGHTSKDIAEKTGYSTNTVRMYLRLEKLPTVIRDAIESGVISFKNAIELYDVYKGNAETMFHRAVKIATKSTRNGKLRIKDAHIAALNGYRTHLSPLTIRYATETIQSVITTGVQNRQMGTVTIPQQAFDDLNMLLEQLRPDSVFKIGKTEKLQKIDESESAQDRHRELRKKLSQSGVDVDTFDMFDDEYHECHISH